MDRAALRAQFRLDADDAAAPYLFADTDVHAWLLEAVEEAAVRADLLLEFDNATVCQLAVVAGTQGYSLHSSISRVTRADFYLGADAASRYELKMTDRVELDRVRPNWRTEEGDPQVILIEKGKARLVPKPTAAGVVLLEVFRRPLTPMATDGDSPEIQALHHRYLVDWALYRAYGRPDTETYDSGRAEAALARFEARFGTAPDADERQAAEIVPQINKAHW